MSKATSPMLSVWMPGEQLDNGSRLCAQVDTWQERLEVELDDGPWGNLPRDHIAVSLGLYALALVSTDQAGMSEEIADAALRETLPRFTAAVIEHTTNPIYRAGARLLLELIHP